VPTASPLPDSESERPPSVASENTKRPKGKEETFEETHQRFTGWMDKKLKKQFDDLVTEKGASKTALLNEAITLLLHKQERKPYMRQK